jgi:cytoskeletal protein CcmA (bactofilin family)
LATREVTCPYCGEVIRVAVRAINTRCTACHKHLLMEDIVIRGDSVQTRIQTCGTILVEPAGRFSGVLQGSEVVIMGRVMGTVIGTQRVEVTSTGKVAGTIATRVLRRHERAVIDGEIQILGGESA